MGRSLSNLSIIAFLNDACAYRRDRRRWINRGWSYLSMVQFLTGTSVGTMTRSIARHLVSNTLGNGNLLEIYSKLDYTNQNPSNKNSTCPSVFSSVVFMLSPINHFCCFMTIFVGGSWVAPESEDHTVMLVAASILTERWNLKMVSFAPALRTNWQPPNTTSCI